MWQQTATAATSDNKKEKETVEDCSCAGGSVASIDSSASVSNQQKSVIEANSKQSKSATVTTTPTTTAFGGISSEKNSEQQKQQQQSSTDAAINKQKEFAAQSETSDSGFISGPQSTQFFSGEISDELDDPQQEPKKHSEQDQRQQQQQQQQQGKDNQATVCDSGFITEEVEVEEQQEGEAKQMHVPHIVELPREDWTSGSIDNINNLDSSKTIATPTANTPTHKKAPTTSTTDAPLPKPNISIMNAWEQFYQQNDDGDTPLHLACISGYVDVVTALIRMAPHPCLLNIQNDVAQTPLHLAALTAQPTIIRMLLLAGAEPTVRDRHGNTALHLSCIAGEKQCVHALTVKFCASEIHEAHRQYGHRSNDKAVSSLSYARLPADLEIRNYDGERCVHLAAEGGHIDILRILVSHGADINAREGKGGRTPLHIAIECCNEDLANFLLDECEKLNLETATYAGLTAYQVASVLNKSRMLNMLKNRGAETLTPPDSEYDSSDIEDLDDTKMYDRFGDPRYFVSFSGGNPLTVLFV
ncbi:hypothetical protein ACLKA7_002978 [Drosophila subpalustris]